MAKEPARTGSGNGSGEEGANREVLPRLTEVVFPPLIFRNWILIFVHRSSLTTQSSLPFITVPVVLLLLVLIQIDTFLHLLVGWNVIVQTFHPTDIRQNPLFRR
jgi:hypothetical protein